jgi:hypothetical protein
MFLMLFYLEYLVILVILTLPALSSVVLNIDIQPSGSDTMSGGTFAVMPSAGSFWNTNGPNYQPRTLLLSDGTDSGLSLTSDLYEMPGPGNGDALYRDYMMGETKIGGLAAGADYEVVFYAGADLMTVFIVDQSFTRLSPDPGYCPYQHKELPGIDGCDYVRGIVTADSAGEFAVNVNLGALAGMQIAIPGPNPEPEVMVLLPLAAMIVARRRRC